MSGFQDGHRASSTHGWRSHGVARSSRILSALRILIVAGHCLHSLAILGVYGPLRAMISPRPCPQRTEASVEMKRHAFLRKFSMNCRRRSPLLCPEGVAVLTSHNHTAQRARATGPSWTRRLHSTRGPADHRDGVEPRPSAGAWRPERSSQAIVNKTNAVSPAPYSVKDRRSSS